MVDELTIASRITPSASNNNRCFTDSLPMMPDSHQRRLGIDADPQNLLSHSFLAKFIQHAGKTNHERERQLPFFEKLLAACPDSAKWMLTGKGCRPP